MDDICRLCCSSSYVNNNIFDEENALYLKMSLYLPIKVFKNDRLPQKVCDKCSCKVNDFYQFCNETIEVQERLRAVLISSGVLSEETVDLTRIKHNVSPLPGPPPGPPPAPSQLRLEQGTQTEWAHPSLTVNNVQETADSNQSENVQIKVEPQPLSPLKEENDDLMDFGAGFSDNSDDMSLITLKKKKKTKKELNGVKKRAPKKKKLKDWNITNGIGETSLSVNEETKPQVKVEPGQKTESGRELQVTGRELQVTGRELQVTGRELQVTGRELEVTVDVKELKQEAEDLELFHCCICFMQHYSRPQLLQHYRQHAAEAGAPGEPPPAPPPPDTEPMRCTRCRKSVCGGAGEWAAHWARHWQRDARPLRCRLCEKGFRDPHQALKHGLTHKFGSGEETQPLKKRFVCDLCPEGFVYMRYLLAHRSQAHPGARGGLVLRCAVCARVFAHLNSLRRHLRAHSGERNHLCNVCGKALSSREHLKFHIRIHTGYKPNVCKTCGKGFVKKCNLTLHERVHSGEKPHVCASCGKAFSQRSTLVIHERYHSGARPYVCALCQRGFVAKGLLSMHLKSTCIWERTCTD